MYNGIGLATPRGTGTSGHIQKNRAHSGQKLQGVYERKKVHEKEALVQYEKFEKSKQVSRKVDPSIAEHEKKREIEVKCFELRDTLEDEGVEENIIEEEVSNLREKLTRKFQSHSDLPLRPPPIPTRREANDDYYRPRDKGYEQRKNNRFGNMVDNGERSREPPDRRLFSEGRQQGWDNGRRYEQNDRDTRGRMLRYNGGRDDNYYRNDRRPYDNNRDTGYRRETRPYEEKRDRSQSPVREHKPDEKYEGSKDVDARLKTNNESVLEETAEGTTNEVEAFKKPEEAGSDRVKSDCSETKTSPTKLTEEEPRVTLPKRPNAGQKTRGRPRAKPPKDDRPDSLDY